MNIYTVFINRDGAEKWFNFAIAGQEQVNVLGKAFPDIARIETWDGDVVYERRKVH